MNGGSEFNSLFDDNLRQIMLKNIFLSYHDAKSPAQVVFDTNRGWSDDVYLLDKLYPDCRVVCCVRDVPAIIGSFERALNNNSLRTSGVLGFKRGASTYWRVKTLMDPDSGTIGAAHAALRGAWYGDKSHMLIAVDYDSLTREPQAVLERLYAALDEPRFEHDFTDIQFNRPEFDEGLGMPGLHKVRERVEVVDREPILPPDIIEKYKDFSFWKDADQGSSKAVRLF